MKLVWVSDFRAAIPSGATSQAILCGKGLRDAGVDVTFCQTPPMSIRGKKYVESDIDGIRVLYPVGNMMNTIYDVDPDIVVVQCYTGALATEIGELVRGYPTAIRVGINVLELLVTPPNFANNIPKVVSFLQQADYLIAASENTKNTLLGLGCREKHIAVVPTAIDPSDFNIADCRDPTIAVLGRVFPVKNHLTLIEAVKLVRKEFPDVELAITGRGRLSKMYQDLVNILCMASQIKQTGFMGDLKWLFREVSILALPSLSENMPMSVLEAYASGVPCILADSGWGDTFKAALKAKHDNPREWADLLLTLLTDREFYLKVRKRQMKELKKFTITTIVPKYLKVFEKLVALQKYKVKRHNPRRI